MARKADKDRWDKLHADLAKAKAAFEEYERELSLKYGSQRGWEQWISKSQRAKLDKLSKRAETLRHKVFELVDRISPRDWDRGVPGWWVATELTWEDAIRPKDEPLSVVVPGSYGYPDGYVKEGASHDRAAGRKYGEETLRSDDFRDWVYDQVYEASQMDPAEVLPLETKADARVIAANTLQQLEWDIKHQLARPEAFYVGLHDALADEHAVDHLADEILNISRDLEGRERQERHSWRPEARESARGHGRKPFAGIDAIDRMIVPIKNGLANIILDGPTDRSDSVLERARGLLADLESQRAPRGHAARWLQGKVDSLRISLATAEAVRSGTRAPGPMTAQDYDRVRWTDTFTEESRSGKIRWGELLAYVPIPDSNGGYRSSDGKWLIGRFHDRYVLKNLASGEMTAHKRLSDAKAAAAGEAPPPRHSGRRATTPRPQWWGIWDETSQEWTTNPLTGNFGGPMRFSDRRSAEHSADRNWRPRNPDRTFTVKPMSEERKMRAYSRELIAEYHTRTGQVGAKVYREHTSRGVTYAYTGKWGGGSGLQKADMKARIDGWLTQKRGVKTITPFSD